MSKKPLCVAILWHMHQPDYGNIQTGEIYLPWTRLHAVKDYYDMAALVALEPRLHLTINVVPSLMDQLQAYGQGKAKETYVALTLRDAAKLDLHEKVFLLRSFFQLPWKEMVLPYPRYKELLEKRGSPDDKGVYSAGMKRYTPRDYRDLQVWFNLSWCGHELRRNPEVEALIEKGRDFSEAEKQGLIEIQEKLIGQILPLYARLAREQGIEVSVSPYYHPILPLLCDNRAAREILSDIPLPANPFAFPIDAREQILRARQRYLQDFGQPPLGMWPSEGSVSDATALLAREAGLRWLASDDGVLYQSLKKECRTLDHLSAQQKFSAYQWGGQEGGPCFFFRDHELSDLIGFTYSRWQPLDAVTDFLSRLHSIHDSLPDDRRYHVVPVILDGENAWEHYPANGAEFLTQLYRGLVSDQRLRTVTFSEFLDIEPHREPLMTIAAGSWIYSSFSTWIGHPEKNRAWDFLTGARTFLAARQREGFDTKSLEEAFREMMIAEGSDWFWWYGDDHTTENAAEFDSLFRTHVKNVYRILDHSYPQELDTPIKRADSKAQYREPVHTISPKIDGKVTSYFEWLAAGFASTGGGRGSMHRVERYLEKVLFGYDTSRFYLRLDLAADRRETFPVNARLQVHFIAPREYVLLIKRDEHNTWTCSLPGSTEVSDPPAFAGGKILEMAIPLVSLGLRTPDEVRFFVAVLAEDNELERFPPNNLLIVTVDPLGLNRHEWIV